MNFVFVSPQFPRTYWHFCDALRRRGANVLGIGDAPYDYLDDNLKAALTEYYRVNDPESYDETFRALAYLSFRHGKVDWIESNNEYWLEQDARLRTDFNVTTGVDLEGVSPFKHKSEQKALYAAAGVPTARCHKVSDIAAARAFLNEIGGYPAIAKPDTGVGAGGTFKLDAEADLEAFFAQWDGTPYVIEEFVVADSIWSYDAILDANSEPLFENSCVFPPSMMDVAKHQLDLMYYARTVPDQLRERGRACCKSFPAARRFVHLEFFRLAQARPGLGEVGDFVGLEFNARPAGGYTPDLMNFAHSTDVYQIWADMVCFGERRFPESGEEHFCVYASRRDCYTYAHSHEDIMGRYGSAVVMAERIPDALSDDLGNFTYTAIVDDEDAMREFTAYVQEQAN